MAKVESGRVSWDFVMLSFRNLVIEIKVYDSALSRIETPAP